MSLHLAPGLYHLRGKNGSGKSTFAKLLSGVLRPSHGRILFGDTEWSAHRTPGRHVSYHFQNPDLQLFTKSVEEELLVSCPGHEDRQEAVIEAFGLGDYLKTHPLDLPFVLRKRLALAVAMASPAGWLVVDEPTLGQDESNARQIAKMLEMQMLNGRGVVVISHSAWFRDLLPGVCLNLRRGQVTYGGS